MERTETKVYIIRHAESEYNLAQRKAKGKDEEVLEDEEDLNVTFDEKLIDSVLSTEGFAQVLTLSITKFKSYENRPKLLRESSKILALI